MGPYMFHWELSNNGFNYSTVGTSETFTSGAGFLFGSNPTYLRLTVTSADNQTAVSFLTLSRGSGSGRIGVDEVETGQQPQLKDAYPNPTTGETIIGYSLPVTASVQLDIINQIGETVAILIKGQKEVGAHTQVFDGSKLPAGLYLYRLQVDGKSITKRLLLAR